MILCCCSFMPSGRVKPSLLSPHQVGRRLTRVNILSGSVVRLGGALEAVLSRHEHSLSRADRSLRVVRVELSGGGADGDGKRAHEVASPLQTNLAARVQQGPNLSQTAAAAPVIGVRFPGSLIWEMTQVVEGQAMQQRQSAAIELSRLGADPLRQPGGGGGGGYERVDPVTPVDPRSYAKCFQAPKTIKDFFSKQGPQSGDAEKNSELLSRQPLQPLIKVTSTTAKQGSSGGQAVDNVRLPDSALARLWGRQVAPPKQSSTPLIVDLVSDDDSQGGGTAGIDSGSKKRSRSKQGNYPQVQEHSPPLILPFSAQISTAGVQFGAEPVVSRHASAENEDSDDLEIVDLEDQES